MLPTQLGIHFWPLFSYVGGIRIDYLSPTIYLTDILIVINLLIGFKSIYRFLVSQYRLVLLFLPVIFLNVLFSISPLNTLIWFTHLFIYLLFVVLLKKKNYSLSRILHPLMISTILVIALELVQFLKQGSLGGILYWFGERNFSVSTPNIAKLDFIGRTILRPYSTFSHPNSLAGYLFIIFLLVYKSKKYYQFLPLLIVGIIVTFSKSTILCLMLFLLPIPNRVIITFAAFNSVLPIISFSDLINSLPNYISSRLYYFRNTISLIIKYPLFGVGYGNHVSALPEVTALRYFSPSNFQPVHNVLILWLSEFGIVSTSYILVILRKVIRNQKFLHIIRYLSVIILLSTFDHYFYTLPQNKLILLIFVVYIV